MARGLTKAILLAVLMNLLMLGVSASPTTGSMNPLGDFEKMDASLEEYIASDDSNTDIEVIFQLNSPITEDDVANSAEGGIGDQSIAGGSFRATTPGGFEK